MAGGAGRIGGDGHSRGGNGLDLRVVPSGPTVPLPSLRGLRGKSIVVLPDVYIDALAFLPPWKTTRARLDAIAQRGGGNLPVGPVEFKLGGNAANLALALARLGAKVELIAETDALGHHLLERAARGTGLGTRRVRVGDRASATLGLESGGANVMLSHAGPLLDFGPDRLEAEDWRTIDEADAVAFVNWAQNDRATDLLRRLAGRLHRRDAFLYVDTGDVRHRLPGARRLLQEKALWRGVGAWGLNENELRAFAGTGETEPVAAASRLARRLGTRLDLHTRSWAATTDGAATVRVAADTTPARRVTGAGDAWNAGNLAAYVLDWREDDRLRLAHRVASQYVTGAAGLPPTAREVAAVAPA